MHQADLLGVLLEVATEPPSSTMSLKCTTVPKVIQVVTWKFFLFEDTPFQGKDKFMLLSIEGARLKYLFFSGSVASGSSSLARDISIRSENVQSNRVLSGRFRPREFTKSARISGGI